MSIKPIDLHLRVTCREGHKTVLEFDLSSPSGRVEAFRLQGESERLQSDPRVLSRHLLQDLERLLEGLWGQDTQLLDEEIEDRLRQLGKKLYRGLLPEAFRDLFEATALGDDGSLLVETEEDWIPWEILHTHGAGGDFLCLRYRMGRWATHRNPAHSLAVNRLLCVDAGKLSDFGPSGLAVLTESSLEASVLFEMTQRFPGLESIPLEKPSHEAVMQRLKRGGFQLLHFIGHGDFPEEISADRAELFLEGQNLTPIDLVDEVERVMREERPLVFLNACRTARQGDSLTGLGGWPQTFVKLCECGAFLAPQWSVHSGRAYDFARSFYRGLERGLPLGEAVRRARLPPVDEEVSAGAPPPRAYLDATSLAYAFYGHPNASVRWGETQVPGEALPGRTDPEVTPPPAGPRPARQVGGESRLRRSRVVGRTPMGTKRDIKRRFLALGALVLVLITVVLVGWRQRRQVREARVMEYNHQGIELLQGGQASAARQNFEQALDLDPGSSETLVNLAYLKLAGGDELGALNLYRQAAELAPEEPLHHYNLGSLLVRREVYDEARIHLDRAVELDPTYAEAYNALGNAWLGLAQPGKARARLEQGLAQEDTADPYTRSILRKNLARSLLAEGDAATAIEHLTRALQGFGAGTPPRREALFLQASAHATLGQQEQTCRVLEDFARSLGSEFSSWVEKAKALAVEQECQIRWLEP